MDERVECSLITDFSKNLVRLLEEHSMERSELADLLGISSYTINHWLTTDHLPRPTTIKKIADVLAVDTSELIGDFIHSGRYASHYSSSTVRLDKWAENFRGNLEFLMEEHCLSSKRLAELLCLDESSIHNWVTGSRKPGRIAISMLASFFKITVDQLLNCDLRSIEGRQTVLYGDRFTQHFYNEFRS